MKHSEIIALLPYTKPFLFVDSLEKVHKDGVEGSYQFKKDSYFYKGHFENNPITPGVLLTECMAQIGVVSLGLFLIEQETKDPVDNALKTQIAMSNTTIDFYTSVKPGERVTVRSEKIYFRFGKLRCKVIMMSAQHKLIAKGTIDGMIVKQQYSAVNTYNKQEY